MWCETHPSGFSQCWRQRRMFYHHSLGVLWHNKSIKFKARKCWLNNRCGTVATMPQASVTQGSSVRGSERANGTVRLNQNDALFKDNLQSGVINENTAGNDLCCLRGKEKCHVLPTDQPVPQGCIVFLPTNGTRSKRHTARMDDWEAIRKLLSSMSSSLHTV